MEPRFTVDVPSGANAPNGLVLVLGARSPQVGAVPTDACREHVLVVIGIGCIGKEGHEAVVDITQRCEVSGVQAVATHQAISIIQHILVNQREGEHVGVIIIERVVVIVDDRLAHLMTQQGNQIVLVGKSILVIQLLTESVGLGRLVRAVINVTQGHIQRCLACTIVIAGILTDQITDIITVLVIELMRLVVGILILEHHIVLEVHWQIDIQLGVIAADELISGADIAANFIKRGDVVIGKTITHENCKV